ncbi:MAG: NAD-dependent epimerase/dehydratase family protein [Actinomycetales bacterium]|nr:NAD-dependent epimerase/dehydratase family protein [Actinomycetales bacterium]
MRVLHVGGTGLLSSACADAGIRAGHEVWLLNRGRTRNVPVPDGVHRLVADARSPAAVAAAVTGTTFDVVVQWIGFTPDQVRADLDLFAGVGQYVFVSSASVYRKPPAHYLVRESSTPLENPFWQYARDKIACELLLSEAHRRTGFPVTVVRPSLTYGPSQIPVCVGSWERPWTIVDRMRRGAEVIVPGDGTSLWTVTHADDLATGLVGLLGNPRAIGEAVHITSDEVLTWNDIYREVGRAAGVEPRLLHVPTDALVAADPELEGTLLGDKVHSTVFDNSRLRDLVPGFTATVPFTEGIRSTIAWFEADVTRRLVDREADALWDRIAEVYTTALARVVPPPIER